ncbi:hypothetical protein B6U91_02380 [Candidatus Pacearchaeota archaeon ex4484_71]|nr:MAG: hypothetical protein B6U91_02380 [Candidatus Pacearchaeota archaeon ex4484_71]
MFGAKKKKKNDEASEESEIEEVPENAKPEKEGDLNKKNGNNFESLSAEVKKLEAGVEAFSDVRKSFMERFNNISEQIGELRAMILERDKNIQEIEMKSMKAADLVETVQPEKISTEIQKQDAKIDALKANIEGNESIMDKIMEELRETRRKIEFFRGVDEIIKLSEETKKELIDIKKVESRINIDADKVETLYAEIRKKYQDIDSFDSELENLKVLSQQNEKDVQFLKGKILDLATKDELDKLVKRIERYIEALKELEKKSSLTKDIDKLKLLLEGLR